MHLGEVNFEFFITLIVGNEYYLKLFLIYIDFIVEIDEEGCEGLTRRAPTYF